jgi:hypothetical protein
LAFNSANNSGGAVYNEAGTLLLVNSTLSHNQAGSSAAVLNEAGLLRVDHSTIVFNRAGYGVAGIEGAGLLFHSILANNVVGPEQDEQDLFGDYTGSAYNLVENLGTFVTGILPGQDGNIVGLDPQVSPLVGAFGGPTLTHLLLPGSPAIDAGDPAFQGGPSSSPPATDQRGLPRVVSSPLVDGLPRTDLGAVELQNATVADRRLFYNESAYDGQSADAGPADDAAVAPDKLPLLPGGTATFANYSSYSRGINGVMIDVAELPGVPTPAEFSFQVGNNNAPQTWSALAIAPEITLRLLPTGATRITLTWPSGTVVGQWLRVALQPSLATGLGTADVFYFGSAVGETGNSPFNAVVNAADEIRIRVHPHSLANPAPINSPFDLNRDRLVNATDQILARINANNSFTALRLIAPPAGALGGPAAALVLEGPALQDGNALADRLAMLRKRR